MSTIPRIAFKALGVSTSQIGFGCGTLTGRATFRQAAALVEAALDLGIRYFDTAPLYGMGTSEEVLGAVIGNAKDVIIATKVGIDRPRYSTTANMARRFLKPLLDSSRPFKKVARQFYAKPCTAASGSSRRYRDLSRDAVRRSLDESLRLLRRSSVEVFLAHDPSEDSFNDETTDVFESLRLSGAVGCYGIALTEAVDVTRAFGNVWQSGWPRNPSQAYRSVGTYVHHGIIRTAAKQPGGETIRPAESLVRDAVAAVPDAVFLVSASCPRKLASLLRFVGR